MSKKNNQVEIPGTVGELLSALAKECISCIGLSLVILVLGILLAYAVRCIQFNML